MDLPRILIVDDTPDNIQVLGNLLKDSFELSVALNGEEALDRMGEMPFDLVLLDIMMPGIDGYEVCRRMRRSRELKDLPVIFLTAKNDKQSVVKGLTIGAQDYLVKPFDKEILLQRIGVHLGNSRNRREAVKQRPDHEPESIAVKHDVSPEYHRAAHEASVFGFKQYVSERCRQILNNFQDVEDQLTDLDEGYSAMLTALQTIVAEAKDIVKQNPRETASLRLINELDQTSRRFLGSSGSLPTARHFKGPLDTAQGELASLASTLTMVEPAIKVSFNLGRMLDKYIRNLPDDWNVVISSELFDDRDIVGPKNLIKVIFRQLLMNSMQAIRHLGGECRIMVDTSVVKGFVRLEWTDDGLGPVAPDKVGHPFFSSKKGFPGTGLAMVKLLLSEHYGAACEFSSPSDGGMTVICDFPAAE